MYWRFGSKAKLRIGRSFVALLVIANHVVIALGVPLPLSAAGSPASAGELFPCVNCPCGCRTAEHCWRHCCCYSMTQKLAWAKAHGVEPPTFVRAAAAKEAESAAASHPEAKKCCPHCHKVETALPEKTTRQGTIIFISALECQGHSSAGLLASLPALLPKAAAFAPTEPLILETLSLATPLLPEVVALVPEPPPRTASLTLMLR